MNLILLVEFNTHENHSCPDSGWEIKSLKETPSNEFMPVTDLFLMTHKLS